MEDTPIITDDALSDAAHVTAADAGSAGGTVAQPEAITLAELNSALGKNFTSKEAALKAYKDTFSFVGQRKEDIKKEVIAEIQGQSNTDALAKELEAMRVERFFDKNPQLESYRAAFEKVGGKPEEFFNSEAFKPIIEKAQGYDAIQSKKTVLESNSRMAQTRDTLKEAAELRDKGASTDAIEQMVASAVLSSLE